MPLGAISEMGTLKGGNSVKTYFTFPLKKGLVWQERICSKVFGHLESRSYFVLK